MALMQKPSGPSPEDTTEPDMVVSLEESGDVEQENVEYSGVAAFIEGQFSRAKDDRMNDEERWMMAYRNYRGLYGSEVKFTDSEKSKASQRSHFTNLLPNMLTECTVRTNYRPIQKHLVAAQRKQA